MKKAKIILLSFFSLALVAFLVSFDSNSHAKLSLRTEKGKYKTIVKPKVRLRWHGIGGPGNVCWKTNRECGDCPGLCILIDFREGEITEAEREEGDAYADVALDGNQLVFESEASVDDGSGKVTITSDYNIGTTVAGNLGKSNIVIKAGEYNIDYTMGAIYGRVVFKVATN